VLFVAYYFPPLGGGGVQRSVAFARYLPECGYRPVVVTRPAGGTVEWGPVDRTLAHRLGSDLRVVRVPGPEPARSSGWQSRGERWLGLDSPFARWWRDGIATAADDARRADVLYASMSPFETAEGVAALARRAGKPWVADLRDPWALDDWLVFPTALHRRLELRKMRRALSTAAAIVMNTPESAAQLARHAPELRRTPILTIPNGFDPAEFDGPAPEREAGVFRIVHAGHVFNQRDGRASRIGRRVLGGAAAGLDTYTRSHVYLLEAVDMLLARRPDLAGKVGVDLVGPLADAERAALPPYVVSHGYQPHAETIAFLRQGDLLFLPMHDLAPDHRARIVPGKTYEYLASGVPILSAVPGGDARELLEAAGNADICAPADATAMSVAIERRVDDWLARMPRPEPDPAVVRRFDRRRLTRDLADAFDLVLGGPARPASAAASPTTNTSEVAT
jgi:glycosyltransferase involved in cell wall biosynthesis